MPELPEVETVRRQLEPVVVGRRITELRILDPRWTQPRPAAEVEAAVSGRTIEALSRRGKYLMWSLDGDVHLVLHLRMTGTILCDPSPEQQYVRVRFKLSPSRGLPNTLVFVDPRRFGTGELLTGSLELERLLDSRLGVEPLDASFTDEHLAGLLRDRRTSIKALLLDQRSIAGVGNIYADEALYAAYIHPLREARRITRRQVAALREAIVEVLEAGIDSRGASIDDFRGVDGVEGSFQDRFRVHLRRGEACERCGREIKKITVAGRGTYVCEHCQPRPRRRA